MKIVFLGDSLTQGNYGANFVNKVAESIRGHHFINQGINGDTSLNLYRRVEKDVIAEKPDGVFIMIGINDAVTYSDPGSRFYYRWAKGVRGGQITPISFRENMRALLTKLRFAQIRVWVALPPAEHRPALVETLKTMNTYSAQLCAEMQIPVLDLLALLTPAEIPERPPTQALTSLETNMIRSLTLRGAGFERLRQARGYSYSFDGIHLTEDAAQRMAEAVVTFLHQNGVSG